MPTILNPLKSYMPWEHPNAQLILGQYPPCASAHTVCFLPPGHHNQEEGRELCSCVVAFSDLTALAGSVQAVSQAALGVYCCLWGTESHLNSSFNSWLPSALLRPSQGFLDRGGPRATVSLLPSSYWVVLCFSGPGTMHAVELACLLLPRAAASCAAPPFSGAVWSHMPD